MRRITVLLAAAVAVAACSDSGPDPDQARLDVEGTASVLDADGERADVVDAGVTLELGAVITMAEGTATLEFADGATYELRAGEPGTEVQVAIPPVLVAGDVLVADGFPATVDLDGLEVSATGATAIDAEDSRVQVYVGSARGTSLGVDGEVEALRSVVQSAQAAPVPIQFDGTDAWDRRFLGDAIAFGERLEALARGYTADLRRSGPQGVQFYEAVIPLLAQEREFNDALLDEARDPGEILVGASIAVQGRDGTFRGRWIEVFTFRDEGAAWGLVALDQGVSAAPVLETVEVAVGASPAVVEDRRPTTTTSPSTTTTTTPGTPSTTTTTTTTTTVPDDDGALDPVLDPVLDVLPPELSDAVDELIDALDIFS